MKKRLLVTVVAVLAVAAVALGVRANGDSSPERSDPTAISSAPLTDEKLREIADSIDETPEQDAQRRIAQTTELDTWEKQLAQNGGGAPTRHWSIRRTSDDSWRVGLELRGPDGHRHEATWQIDHLVGRGATPDEVRAQMSADLTPKPLDEGARQLGRLPFADEVGSSG